jgi:hypothetical protein
MTKYPLAWPAGWKRYPAHQRTRAQFNKSERVYSSSGNGSYLDKKRLSVFDAIQRVLGELGRLGVREGDAIISTNLRTRLDGLPRSDQAEPADPGAAVYWQRRDQPTKCMASDRYDRVADNLAALAATLEAMRAIERHGGAQILERAFQGFDALPAPGQTSRTWRDVLGVSGEHHGAVALEVAEKQYRILRSTNHPDKGGSGERFHEVETAWQQAQKELER